MQTEREKLLAYMDKKQTGPGMIFKLETKTINAKVHEIKANWTISIEYEDLTDLFNKG